MPVSPFRHAAKRWHRTYQQMGMVALAFKSADHPVLAPTVVTRRCNTACMYRNEFDDFSKPVPTAEMMRRVAKLAELETTAITLMGGEPLLHPDLDQIIQYFGKVGDSVNVLSINKAARRKWFEGSKFFALILVSAAVATQCAAQSSGPAVQQPLTSDQIVSEMVSHNKARAAALPDYSTRQICQLQYHGFPSSRSGEMVLQVRYTAGGKKEYALISESGSKFVINHVLKRLLDGEQEAQNGKNRQQTAITPDNYTFRLIGEKTTVDGRFYVLRADPKVKNKFVFRGQIWVDATDFAIARIVAEPAKNPSFWITDTKIKQQYAKFGSFWLPVQNESTSRIRVVGGTATLLIQYKDYLLAGSTTRAAAMQQTKTPD
jgi:hypothetical protein